MSAQEKKDIVVIARKGYTVLLDVAGRTLDINSYNAVNLSNMFSADILEHCASLSAHLDAGNLIPFNGGIKLSEDTNTPAEVKPLRTETAQHITAQYDQTERDVNRTDMELETRANITDNTREHIQDQVQAGKEKILQTDRKFLKRQAVQTSNDTTNDNTATVKNKQKSMTVDELHMAVSMDIKPEEFAKRQAELKRKFDEDEEANEMRAEKEIARQDIEEDTE